MTVPFSPDPTKVSLLLEEVSDATERFANSPDETTRLQVVKSLAKITAFISSPVQEVFRIAGMVCYMHYAHLYFKVLFCLCRLLATIVDIP